MKQMVRERVRRKGGKKDFLGKSKTGFVLAFKVSFRDFNPTNSYIWFELYGSPTDRDVDLIGSVCRLLPTFLVIQTYIIYCPLPYYYWSNKVRTWISVQNCSSPEAF
ncbi:hypothetical protein IFM89_027509 [Coptis chinensis]|uniref:Uncharacterized protein n=1 Tax=Coptis chinensis TaxID=261450 RepID=A0A835I240_9MAGN|nr:hypothetical protein IFM89_027509 [Coptis chinensis]